MRLPVIIALAFSLLLWGCASGTGVRWWSPATWTSGSEARATDRAIETRDVRREAVLAAGHIEVAKTVEALTDAPESREVTLAQRFSGNAAALFDQALGPLPVDEVQALKQLVAELRSENAAIRATAEERQHKSESAQATLSSALGAAQKKLAAAQGDLRQAFERENALANTLRNERMIKWGLAGLAVLLALGWAYVRYFAGGIPSAIGSLLASTEKTSPKLAEDFRALLDAKLNRHEQAHIAGHYLKSR